MAMNEDLGFAELCRLCSLKSNHQLQIFDKESEQRQLLFKIRSCVPIVVSKNENLLRSRTALLPVVSSEGKAEGGRRGGRTAQNFPFDT